jgi:hypothetical protein
MSNKSDFEIGGRLRARTHAARPPDTMTIQEHVRVERKESWHKLEGPLASGETHEDVEIEKLLRGAITAGDETGLEP